MRFVIPLGIFLALAVMLGMGLQRDPRALESALLDQPVPVFELPQLQAQAGSDTFSPQALQGQVWLLNVWASWCAPCRQEMPVLAQMSKQDQVPVYGLNYKDDVTKALALFVWQVIPMWLLVWMRQAGWAWTSASRLCLRPL